MIRRFKREIGLILCCALAICLMPSMTAYATGNKEPAESVSIYKDKPNELCLDVESCANVQYGPIGCSSHFSYDAENDALKISNIKITRRDATVHIRKVSAVYVVGECVISAIKCSCLSEDFYGNPPYCSTVKFILAPGASLEVSDMYDYDGKDVDKKITTAPGVKMKVTQDGKAQKYSFTLAGAKVGTKTKVKGNTYKVLEGGTVELTSGKASKNVKIDDTVVIKDYAYKIVTVGKNSYKNKKDIKSVKLGNNVTTIGKNAFRGCANLKKITINAATLTTIEKDAFKGINKKAVFTLTGTPDEIARAKALIMNKSTGYKKSMKFK